MTETGATATSRWLLIADPDAGFGRVLQILIEEERAIPVRLAQTPHEVDDALGALGGPPDLVICALAMTRSGGSSLVSWLRRTHPKVPVITTTAHPTTGTRGLACQLGIRAYLTTPVEPARLLAAIDHVMEPAGAGAAPIGRP